MQIILRGCGGLRRIKRVLMLKLRDGTFFWSWYGDRDWACVQFDIGVGDTSVEELKN